MSPFNDATSDRIDAEAQKILMAGGTPQCVTWAERPGLWRFRRTFRLNGNSTPNDDEETPHLTTYCIGSITKILVATATIILLDQFAQSEDKTYEHLRDAWQDSISKHLNIMIRRQTGPDPTISDLLCHMNGPPSMNDFILGPDGTVLMSKESFLTTANKIIMEIHEHTNGNDSGWRYNNGGYILAGLLIEQYSGLTLGEFLKQTLFIPLGMNSTYATSRDFEALEEKFKAPAHIVSANGQARPIQRPKYFDETVALAAAGIYSCTKDLALFSRKVLDVLETEDLRGNLNCDTATRLCFPRIEFGKKSSNFYAYCGYRTTLDTTFPGSHSPNRAVSPLPSKFSGYTFGVGQDVSPVEVIYHGGSVTGYECSFYLIPNSDAFVIALSNATGLVDVSDHLSRLLLQELLLQPSDKLSERPLRQNRPVEQNKKLKSKIEKRLRQLSRLPARIDIAEMALGGADARRLLLQQFQPPSHRAVTLNLPRPRTGYYVNRTFRQSIFVEENDESSMTISIGGDIGVSGRFMLLQTSDSTASVYPFADDRSAVLGIDVVGDWGYLDFQIGRDSRGNTVTFTRNRRDGLKVTYRYEEMFSEVPRGVFHFGDVL